MCSWRRLMEDRVRRGFKPSSSIRTPDEGVDGGSTSEACNKHERNEMRMIGVKLSSIISGDCILWTCLGIQYYKSERQKCEHQISNHSTQFTQLPTNRGFNSSPSIHYDFQISWANQRFWANQESTSLAQLSWHGHIQARRPVVQVSTWSSTGLPFTSPCSNIGYSRTSETEIRLFWTSHRSICSKQNNWFEQKFQLLCSCCLE